MIDITLKILGKKIHLGGKEGATAKGVHILSVADARSEKAQKISDHLESIRFSREQWYQAGLIIEKSLLNARITGDWKSFEYFQKQLEVIEEKMKNLWDDFQYHIKSLHKDFLLRQKVVENITTTVGRTVSARRLSGNNTYSGNVNYTALGTDNTAAVVGDTQLGTETYRKAISSGTFANNIAYLETFYTASEVSGTFQEYGNFIDGSGAADSGQLFNRFTQTVTKSVTETLNVQSTVTFNDA